jgi:enoyl-CoA hydratase/carnithine racemase
MAENTDDLSVDLNEFVATIEITRPPHNYFDVSLIDALADTLEQLDEDRSCRAVVLCSRGKNFCAGAQLSASGAGAEDGGRSKAQALYTAGLRLFKTQKPVVAAIQGAAVGGGLGLALVADFRVACPEASFSANFSRLGFHPGFGLSVTLPELVGHSMARLLFYTGRRIGGEEAVCVGLADQLATSENLRSDAQDLAREIALAAPLAVQSIRKTLRGDLPERIESALERELSEQTRLRQTDDFKEGVAAVAARRRPNFRGS